MNRYSIRRLLLVAATLLLARPVPAQDLLKAAPGYARYQALSHGLTNDAGLNAVSVTWREEGKSFDYSNGGKRLHFDIASQTTTAATNSASGGEGRRRSGEDSGRRSRPPAPGRGRQYSNATSPDGKWKAFYRERNLWLSETNNTNAVALTTDGNQTNRVKNGSASWVYGEELRQSTAIWWSSNSQKVAFYRFDESKVRDYYLTLDLTNLQSREFAEAYPKAGTTNPLVDVLVYDLPSKRTVKLDVRDGQPFDNDTIGHYVYGIAWSPDSREVLFHRTNRKQNIQEFCAGDPETGKCRVIIREEWPQSWVENLLPFQFLKDGQRFLWASDRSGWRNYYLYNLKGELLGTVTDQKSDCGDIVHVDEDAGQVYYQARTGDNPLKLQLHRVGLDGKNDERLTDPAFHHTIDFAPDGKHFIDVAQTHDFPPSTCLRDNQGHLLSELRHGDLAEFKKQKLRSVELFKFKAADGQTDLYGMLHFPSRFSSWKKYPLLVTVYAGPETSGAHETFTIPNAL
ncbi:MAG TPA: DPP IV N-terminal domain-containing protein, partial [Terriglobales bacterium]|nr:DPP IV N-terminal domain-containing protein [Terriglobales bacterium]